MAVRTTMANVIAELRNQIGDTATDPVFEDQELQTILDGQRQDVRYLPLTYVESIAAGGVITYLEYRAPAAFAGWYWEDDPTLQDGAWATLSAAGYTPDYQAGQWLFDANQDPPVYLSGSCFNLALAAADALERWAVKVKLDFDFTADGATYNRSQKIKALLDAAKMFRSYAPARTVQVSV